jgi:Glucosyltransferase 24
LSSWAYLRAPTSRVRSKLEADIRVAGAAGEAAKGEEADDRVHVFTVASGHMYERLQKIMVLSVLRNTKCGLCAPLGPMSGFMPGSHKGRAAGLSASKGRQRCMTATAHRRMTQVPTSAPKCWRLKAVLLVCRSRLKVWFIKNYMSPQMRAFVPRMAARYGFDYEFVTYKWPSWLHKQVGAA